MPDPRNGQRLPTAMKSPLPWLTDTITGAWPSVARTSASAGAPSAKPRSICIWLAGGTAEGAATRDAGYAHVERTQQRALEEADIRRDNRGPARAHERLDARGVRVGHQ